HSHFLFTHPPPPLHSTLSLHDALPISSSGPDSSFSTHTLSRWARVLRRARSRNQCCCCFTPSRDSRWRRFPPERFAIRKSICHRSEEHTSELQSRFDLVCRLLLEKKKK